VSQTGRNPEVEEVLGALSALLNGGGVAQIKTIATELNTAVGGREQDVREVLDQIHTFMGELDANKTKVVGAIDHLNTLAIALNKQDGTIKTTLADLPSAIQSVNTQRADLRKLLASLSKLSDVGVHVIQASKEATINSLSDLSPVLSAFAASGQNLPKALQVFLTYPFIDAAVGNDPVTARNLHIGDYVNLNAQLDLNLTTLIQGLGGGTLPINTTLPGLVQICHGVTPGDALAPLCNVVGTLVGGLCGLSVLSTSPLCTNGNAPTISGLNKSLAKAKNSKVGSSAADQSAIDQVHSLLSSLFGNALGSGTSTNGATGTSGTSGSGTSGSTGSGSSGGLIGGLLGGLGLGRVAPAYDQKIDKKKVDAAVQRLRGVAGVGTLLLQGVYS
jgi:phospholipid/cholesterol/gamma-HCH transport system substrate-binding protein